VWADYCERCHAIPGGAFFPTLWNSALRTRNLYRVREWHEYPNPHPDQLRIIRGDDSNPYLERPASAISPYQVQEFPEVYSESSLPPGMKEPSAATVIERPPTIAGTKLVGRRIPQCTTLRGYLVPLRDRVVTTTIKSKSTKKRRREYSAAPEVKSRKKKKTKKQKKKQRAHESPPTAVAPRGLPCGTGDVRCQVWGHECIIV
jgi:hypothetical protein